MILTSNANEFSGYTTTFEKYQTQHYEAGFTLFGQYTLAAYQTAFTKWLENSVSQSKNGTFQKLRNHLIFLRKN